MFFYLLLEIVLLLAFGFVILEDLQLVPPISKWLCKYDSNKNNELHEASLLFQQIDNSIVLS